MLMASVPGCPKLLPASGLLHRQFLLPGKFFPFFFDQLALFGPLVSIQVVPQGGLSYQIVPHAVSHILSHLSLNSMQPSFRRCIHLFDRLVISANS